MTTDEFPAVPARKITEAKRNLILLGVAILAVILVLAFSATYTAGARKYAPWEKCHSNATTEMERDFCDRAYGPEAHVLEN